IVEEVDPVDPDLVVAVERHGVDAAVVLVHQRDGGRAAGVAPLRVGPVGPVLRDELVEVSEHLALGEVAVVGDLRLEDVEAAVARRQRLQVLLAVVVWRVLDELDLDSGFLLEQRSDGGRTLREGDGELADGAVPDPPGERDRLLAVVRQLLEAEDRPAGGGVGSVLVALGAGEPRRAADVAAGEPVSREVRVSRRPRPGFRAARDASERDPGAGRTGGLEECGAAERAARLRRFLRDRALGARILLFHALLLAGAASCVRSAPGPRGRFRTRPDHALQPFRTLSHASLTSVCGLV